MLSGALKIESEIRASVRLPARLAFIVAMVAWMGGCAPEKAPGASNSGREVTASSAEGPGARRGTAKEAITPTDPCAFRMHDIAGQLLLYYAVNKRLPERIDQLGTLPGADGSIPRACPVSNRPYVYVPGGVAVPNHVGGGVLFDPEPSHSDHHWAVIVAEPADPQDPLIMKVVAVPPAQLPRAARSGR